LTLKNADEEQLNVYADYCNVLSALCYSNLVYGWGNVPYITKYNELTQSNIPAETAKNILNDLKNKLLKAIDNLEEKKNESLKDINGFFFASKDVARVLLANIYMYENDHNKAMPLLQKVIDNNFYTLDASTNFAPDNTVGNGDINATRSINVTESTEVIFALLYDADAGTRGQTTITIRSAGVLPYITLSDVYLSLAECYCKSGASDQAKQFINDVVKAKSLTISESDVLMQIKEVREQILLYSGTYFTFLKRSGIAKEVCAIDDYQLLFPIPQKEIDINYNLTQNDGY
jgi:tetratricopeptide (TPR) repeat protein